MNKDTSIDYNVLKEDLKNSGYKLTPQRRTIVDTIVDSEGKRPMPTSSTQGKQTCSTPCWHALLTQDECDGKVYPTSWEQAVVLSFVPATYL